RRASDEERYAIRHGEAQAQGKRDEECGGAAMETEVSGLQLYERGCTKAADSAESGGSVQRASTGTHEPEQGCQRRTNGGEANPVSAGVDRLLRQMRNAFSAGGSGQMDQTQAEVCDLASMAIGIDKVCATSSARRGQGSGRSNGWQRSRPKI